MRLEKKLSGSDSVAAAALRLQHPDLTLLNKFYSDTSKTVRSLGPEYLPNVDSLRSMLLFLNQHPDLVQNSGISGVAVQQALNRLTQLEVRLQNADALNQFVQARSQQLQQYIKQFPDQAGSLNGAAGAYMKQAYYYADELKQCRQALNQPDKLLQTAMGILSKLPAFQDYIQQNAFLSGLFHIPGNYGNDQDLVGMQTRDQVLSMIQGKMGQWGGSGMSSLQQNLQTAQQDVSKMQNKLGALGGGSEEMPETGFKPNNQHNKTLFHRLVYGVNIQTTRANFYFPAYSDLGMSLGYNLGHDNIIGIGASYKVGWGTGIQHVAVSSQGAGLRSFLTIKIKKSFSLAGGYELNYLEPFSSFRDVKDINNWTQSGLIGIAKTVSIKSPAFKKTQVQLLWDFLSYQQSPRTNPLIFRIGYTF